MLAENWSMLHSVLINCEEKTFREENVLKKMYTPNKRNTLQVKSF